MSAAQPIKKTTYLAFDIETTGQNNGAGDCLFGIGFAYGTVDEGVKERGKFMLDLGKRPGMNWRTLWETSGYEMRCFDDFWSKNLTVLNALQAQDALKEPMFTGPRAERQMARRINDLLAEVEKSTEEFSIVFDTTAFDSVWVDSLLTRYGFPSLLYHRDGKYHFDSTFDSDSYIRGVSGALPHLGRKRKRELKKSVMDGFVKEEGDHDPEVDAANILNEFFHVIKKQEQHQKEKDACAVIEASSSVCTITGTCTC